MRRSIPIVLLVLIFMLSWPVAQAFATDDDVPGTSLAVGASISQTVDANDVNDVYSVELTAGEEVYIRCDPGNTYSGKGTINLLVPGAVSITQPQYHNEISIITYGGTPHVDKHGGYFYYIPATTGTYYLWVQDWEGTLSYTLSVARSSRTALTLATDSDDLPGTSIGPGTVTGVVSTLADHYDFYAVTLTAGKQVTIQLAPLTPYSNAYTCTARVSLLDPSTTSADSLTGHIVAGPGDALASSVESEQKTASIQYTPAQSGTYYVLVEAGPFVDPSSADYLGMNFAYSLTTSGNSGSSGSGGSFSDVSGSPYETAIYDLAGRGIIGGFEDGTFRPKAAVTRQQFAKMIVKTLGLPVTGTEKCPFTDVVAQTGTDPFYPSKYVAVCALYSITTGKTSTTFAPGQNITRQQLITMVVRAADLDDPPADYVPSFKSGQFSLTEHYRNARKAAYAGLLEGLAGVGPSYEFGAPATRGECAQILHNLLGRASSD